MARTSKIKTAKAKLQNVGAMRIVLSLAVGLVAAYFAFAISVSGIARTKNPDTALMFIPSESTALATKADLLFFANPENPPKKGKSMALRALRQQPINPKALRLLGFYADASGDAAQAEKYVRLAAQLSRREQGAQLWLIEAAARDNNTELALKHYDIALRTKASTQTLLFPRLLSAIEDPAIRVALKPYIRAKNDWATGFLFFANANGKNLPALVDLRIATGGLPDRQNAHEQEKGLLVRLIGERRFVDARRLYLEMSGAEQSRLTSAAFDITDRDNRFGSIGWQLLDDPDAGGSFSRSPNGEETILTVFGNAATTRPVASKILYLKPETYRFNASHANLDRGEGGFLRWQLRCPKPDNDHVFWHNDTIAKSITSEFSIPSDCPTQFLDLIVSGGKGQTGLEATVAKVSVLPAERSR